jgi:hypothetical protein
MIPDPNPIPYLYDALVNFTRGIDTSRTPDLLDDGFSSFAVNTTFRGGKPTTRPQFTELMLPEQTYLEDFRYDKHQGDTIYQDYTSDNSFLITVRGGYVYRLDFQTLQLTRLNTGLQNDATRRHYFQQVDKFLVIQNGVDIPLIYDGITMRRSKTGSNNLGIDNVSIVYEPATVTGLVTTNGNHGFVMGDYVTIWGNILPTAWIGNYKIKEIVNSTQFRIDAPSSTVVSSSPSGRSYYPFEVPVGLFMEYVMGRLCVVSPDRKTMRIGDLIRTAPETNGVESVLWFTEQEFLAEFYEFSLPATQGRIRAIRAIPFMGSATGQGQLMISGDRGISTLNLSLPRTQWQTSPIQQIALSGVGVASHTGIVGYNGDLLFRDLEYGIRSFRLADARFTKTPTQTPLSAEMNRIYSQDNQKNLQFSCLEVFDNRLLSTVTPVFAQRRIRVNTIAKIGSDTTITFVDPITFQVGDIVRTEQTSLTVPGQQPDGTGFPVTEVINSTTIKVTAPLGGNQTEPAGFIYSVKTGAEYYHKGLAVLDYTSLSGAGGEFYPAWDGLWTGLNVQSIQKAYVDDEIRCFITHYNDQIHRNEIWEIKKEQGLDTSGELEIYPECWVEMRTLSCGQEKEFSQKKLLGLDLYISELRGNFNAQIYYRNDGDPCWNDWIVDSTGQNGFEVCASSSSELVSETNPLADGITQNLPQRRVLKIGQPPFFVCEPTTNADGRLFYETQLKISWTGLAIWDRIRLMALEQIEDMRGGCY